MSFTEDLSNLRNRATMRAYWSDWKLMLRRASFDTTSSTAMPGSTACRYGNPHVRWGPADFHRHDVYIAGFTRRTGVPVVLWQLPLGNTTLNDTWGHFRDNRVQWWLGNNSAAHLRATRNAGVIGLLFGGGATGATRPRPTAACSSGSPAGTWRTRSRSARANMADAEATALRRPDGLGAQPRRAGPRLPEHRDGRRERAARRDGARARVGELALAHSYEQLVDHDALDPDRRRRDLRRPAPVGQRGPDDVLLPRRRARGQARARHGRAAPAPAAGDPGPRGARRDGGARSRSTSRSTPAVPARTAGARRCRPTRRSRSARSRC